MAQRASVAISRIAKGATICITRVDGATSARGHFFKPVEYQLDSDDPTEIRNMVARLVEFDTTLTDNGVSFSYPLSTPWKQWNGYEYRSYDHYMAFVNGYDYSSIISGNDNRNLNVLFIDLNPGQSAFQFNIGLWNGRRWCSRESGRSGVLKNTGDLSPQNIVDKIFKPSLVDRVFKRAKSNERFIDLIGLFRLEGASPEITAALEAQSPNSTIKWVSLADLSYGAAVVMHDEPTSIFRGTGTPKLSLPLGITLANGEIVTVMVRHCEMPRDEVVLFTNSRDNQKTATIRLVRGTLPSGVIIIGGLSEKPKGEGRIDGKKGR